MNLLGYREEEVWQMTLRKFFLLYDAYLKHKGVKPSEEHDTYAIDDMWDAF